MDHKAALISVSVALSLCCMTADMGLVHRMVWPCACLRSGYYTGTNLCCFATRHMGVTVNNLPKAITRRCSGQESNSRPSSCESNNLTPLDYWRRRNMKHLTQDCPHLSLMKEIFARLALLHYYTHIARMTLKAAMLAFTKKVLQFKILFMLQSSFRLFAKKSHMSSSWNRKKIYKSWHRKLQKINNENLIA